VQRLFCTIQEARLQGRHLTSKAFYTDYLLKKYHRTSHEIHEAERTS